MIKQLGFIEIPPKKMGLVYKKSGKSTKGQIALNGEAGYQADLLPEGRHKGYFSINYKIIIIDPIRVKPGEIAIVEALDGKKTDINIPLGKVVECNNFQDARAFIKNGGQKGKQLEILREGEYFINPALFNVFIKDINQNSYPDYYFKEVIVPANEIALVRAKYGEELEVQIGLGKIVSCSNFQDIKAFIDKGGQKGMQLGILTEGQYAINHLFFEVFTKDSPGEYPNHYFQKITVPANEIALVMAKYGNEPEIETGLGKIVSCSNFQDINAFINNGGERGKQLGILTEGQYAINPLFFEVISKSNATEARLEKKDFNRVNIPKDMMGIVNVLVGRENEPNGINLVNKELHKSYQDPQAFFEYGGYKGVQEEVLTPGSYAINPWFAKVELAPVIEVPTGTVGVVISSTGKVPSDNELVTQEYRGIWSEPLREGKHYLNPYTKKIKLIPTNEIVLNWNYKEKKDPSNYDIDLEPIKLGVKQGYTITIAISQTIRIIPEEAPKLILLVADSDKNSDTEDEKKGGKYPAIKNLISRKIKGIIESYFMATAQTYNALEFRQKQNEIQQDALSNIKIELRTFGVEAKSLSIKILEFPKEIDEDLQRQDRFKATKAILENEMTLKQIEADKTAQIKKTVALGDAEAKKIEAITDVEIYTATEGAKAKIAKEYANIEILKEKGIIEAYGRDTLLEIKRVENLAKVKFPEYSRMDMTQFLLEEFYDSKSKKMTTEGISDDDLFNRIIQILQLNNMQLALRPDQNIASKKDKSKE